RAAEGRPQEGPPRHASRPTALVAGPARRGPWHSPSRVAKPRISVPPFRLSARLARLIGGMDLRRGAGERAADLLGARPFCRNSRDGGLQDFALGGQPMKFGFAIAAAVGKPDLVGAFADAVVQIAVHAGAPF